MFLLKGGLNQLYCSSMLYLKGSRSRMKRYSDNVKATFFLGIASFVTSGINYITTPIFTRLLSTAEYGLISKYNSIYLIVSVIATLTLSRPGILSVGLYDHKENRWLYLSIMLGEVLTASLLTFAIICLIWKPFLSAYLKLPFSLMILILASCVIQPAMTFWMYKQRYEYKWKSTFLISVGVAIFAQIVSIASVIYFKTKLEFNLGEVRLVSAAIVNLTASFALYVYILHKGKRFVDITIWKSTLLFALPLIPHYFGFALLTGTDKIMIGYMLGDDKAGIYSLAAVISTVGALLWQALCVSITPFVYEKLGKREFRMIDSLTKPLLELVGLFCITISLFAPEIIAILGTKEYSGAEYVIPAAVAGTFMHVMYDLFSNVAFFNKKSIDIMTATLIAALTNVVFNYICINEFGYIAAGYTTLFSYLVLAFLHYRISRKLGKETIFDWKYDVILSTCVIVICLFSISLYNVGILRYLLIVCIFVLVVARRNKYIKAIGEMRI